MTEDNKNLLLGVALVSAVVGGIVLVGKVVAPDDKPRESAAAAELERIRAVPLEQRTWTRDQFLSNCGVGFDYIDCTKLVGKPDRTQGGSGRNEYYYYSRRTIDPVTGKRDSDAQVVLESGRVKAVNFY